MTAPASPATRRRLEVLRHHRLSRSVAAAARHAPCHLVGGVIRDRLLGLPGRDLDVVVGGGGREIAERLAAALPARLVQLGGDRFSAFRLVGGGFVIDLWDRGAASLESDLERRDFTVNAMALALDTGELVDPWGGLGDLADRLLRPVSPQSFAGDPLRVLRLARLVVQLPGFAVDPDALALARRAAPGLVEVARERLRDELTSLWREPRAHLGATLLAGLDVYPGLWLGSPGVPAAAGQLVRHLELLLPAERRLRQLTGCARDAVDAALVRQALVLANLPEPQLERWIDRTRTAGLLTRQTARRLAPLATWKELPAKEPDQRWFLYRSGTDWGGAAAFTGVLASAAGRARDWEESAAALGRLLAREGAALLAPPSLVSGDDVQVLLRIGPGREVGRVLAAVRRAQVEGRITSRDEAIRLVRGMSVAGRWRGGT